MENKTKIERSRGLSNPRGRGRWEHGAVFSMMSNGLTKTKCCSNC